VSREKPWLVGTPFFFSSSFFWGGREYASESVRDADESSVEGRQQQPTTVRSPTILPPTARGESRLLRVARWRVAKNEGNDDHLPLTA
jgi:hypothetical protein